MKSLLLVFSLILFAGTSLEKEVEAIQSNEVEVTSMGVSSPEISFESNMLLNCKWAASACPSGQVLEVCLVTGDGFKCKCGTVTRSCDDDDQQ